MTSQLDFDNQDPGRKVSAIIRYFRRPVNRDVINQISFGGVVREGEGREVRSAR